MGEEAKIKMKIIGTPSSKINTFSSDVNKAFYDQFNNKKRKTKKRIRFTLRPSKKSVNLEEKQYPINQNTNNHYLDIPLSMLG